MTGNWSKVWNLIKGKSSVGQAIRAVIYYVVGLLVLYAIGRVSDTIWALVTALLLLASVNDMLKNSEASLRFLVKRLPSSLVTILLAYALGQTLDYAFGILFFVFLGLRFAERYHIF